MNHYQTIGLVNDRTDTLYSGNDPVEAVRVGLDDTEHLETWVEENGIMIPQTLAR